MRFPPLRRRREPAGRAPVRVHVAGLSSRTHLLYAASYLRHLLDRTMGPVEVVASPSGGLAGAHQLTAKDVECAWPDDPQLTFISASAPMRPGTRTVLLSVGVPGIKPYLRVLSRERRRPWVVVCDEGIGSYGDRTTRRAALRREGASVLRASLVAAARTIADRTLADQRWCLYSQDKNAPGTWMVNEDVAAEFRRSISRSRTPKRCAVYLTQPWIELGLITPTAYQKHLDAVAAACASVGLAMQVRPHPAEDPHRHAAFTPLSGALPAELDPRVVDAAVVLGGASTALLNLSSVHGVPAIRVKLDETEALDSAMSTRQKSLFDAFVRAPTAASDLAPLLPSPPGR